MQRQAVELSNVIYNAATQSFEAMATIYQGGDTLKIACAIDAPINMSFSDAADGLTRQALRRLSGRGGMKSRRTQDPKVAQRAGRQEPSKVLFDPVAMLRRWAA